MAPLVYYFLMIQIGQRQKMPPIKFIQMGIFCQKMEYKEAP
jgi:hypothetical protein